MRTHTVGGNRHILQVFETARKFNCDMIVMYDDIGCKGMAGCQGLIEEEFRRHSDEFHICWLPHALMDYRTVPTRGGAQGGQRLHAHCAGRGAARPDARGL